MRVAVVVDSSLRLIALAIVLCAGCGGSSAPRGTGAAAAAAPGALDLSSPEAFTESVRLRLSKHGRAERVTAGNEPLVLHFQPDNGGNLQINLHRTYDVCLRVPAECEATVAGLERALGEIGVPEKLAPEMLVAALRPREYGVYVQSQTPEALIEPFVGDLVVVYMFDFPDRTRVALTADLAELGLDRAGAIALALRNTEARVGRIGQLVLPVAPDSLGRIARGEFFDSSLLLQQAGWAEVAKQQEGTLLVSVPAFDVVLYVWAHDAQDVEAMRGVTQGLAARAERPLSPSVYRWNGAAWEPLP